MSLGGGGFSPTANNIYNDAYANGNGLGSANENGVLIIAAGTSTVIEHGT